MFFFFNIGLFTEPGNKQIFDMEMSKEETLEIYFSSLILEIRKRAD